MPKVDQLTIRPLNQAYICHFDIFCHSEADIKKINKHAERLQKFVQEDAKCLCALLLVNLKS